MPLRQTGWKISKHRAKDSPPELGQEATEQLPLTLPLDISDSEWLEEIQRSGFLNSDETTATEAVCEKQSEAGSHKIDSSVTSSTTTNHSPRTSIGSIASTTSNLSADSSSDIQGGLKLHTPRIGNIQRRSCTAANLSRRQAATAAGKTRSIDLIAKQYQAFLKSREEIEYDILEEQNISTDDVVDPQPGFNDEVSELSEKEGYEYHDEDNESVKKPEALSTIKETEGFVIPFDCNKPLPNCECELLGFNEDRIFFRPTSYPPDIYVSQDGTDKVTHFPTGSPQHSDQILRASSEIISSTKKCEDMLANEVLSSTMVSSQQMSASDTKLHLSNMIKTYEKLRDQVTDHVPRDEVFEVRSTFDSWLRSLNMAYSEMVK